MQPHAKGGQKLFGIDRLGQIVRRPGLKALFPIPLHRLGGEGDDGQATEQRIGPDHLHGLVAVHARHHDVHQDDGHVRLGFDDRHGFEAGGRRQNLHPSPLQDAGQGEDVAGVVVDQQHRLIDQIDVR